MSCEEKNRKRVAAAAARIVYQILTAVTTKPTPHLTYLTASDAFTSCTLLAGRDRRHCPTACRALDDVIISLPHRPVSHRTPDGTIPTRPFGLVMLSSTSSSPTARPRAYLPAGPTQN